MEYDWNSLEIGYPELNSSKAFFRSRHPFHESSRNNEKNDIATVKPNKGNTQVQHKQIGDKQNTKSGTGSSNSTAVTIAAKGKQTSKDKENNSSSSTNSRAIVAVSITQKQSSVLNKNLKNQEKKASALTSESSKPSSSKADPKVVKPVAVSDMTGKKAHMTSIGHRQFEQAEVQKKRKEQLIQKLKEQEQKELKFQFHAKAAPKVKKVVVAQKQTSVEERKIVKQKSLPHITLSKKMSRENVFPSCGDPERLKSIIEKKKMLVAKYQETQVQFKAKPATVLKKQPFQPVHNNVKVVDPKPFKLQLTTRLLQRSEFDKKLHETITIRKLQEEKFKRQQDAEILKKNRQKTEFRANPIRSYHKL